MASDARSILGVKSDVSTSNDPVQAAMSGKQTSNNRSTKPPLGISREVFNLLQQQNEEEVNLATQDVGSR